MGSNLPAPDDGDAADPGFFPAITHFSNSMTALPKEMIRHYTMLKEVDAKIYGPEELLGQLLSGALEAAPPARPSGSEPPDAAELEAPTNDNRRNLFKNMRTVMGATLAILDEKNHVMNTAMDALDRQHRRCESSYPYIEDEISEEARHGSLTHWAYSNDKAGDKKSILVGERTRRQANAVEAEVASRSEQRREAVKTSKGRNQHIDSDFDDSRAVGKKGQTGAKGRKIADLNYGANGVGVGSAAAPPSKRRKTEKAAVGGIPMERAMSSVYGSSTGAVGRGSARDAPGVDTKKKSRAAATSNGNSRPRGNTNASGINSPMASSPIMGTFAATAGKGRQGRSPAPPMQRMPSSRARQNSTQNVMTLSRNRSSSTNHKTANGGSNSMYGTTADIDKVSGLTGRTVGDVKSNMKEAVNSKGEHLVEDIAGSDGAGDMRGGLLVGSRNGSTKREEQTETSLGRARADRPGSISTRGGPGSKAPSANPTPRDATFGESSQRSRQPRGGGDQPQKRSHKKGAGLAAQLAAQAAQNDDEGSSVVGDEDEEEGENEPRYCYCNGVSYGEMVGCDSDDCPKEWFHLQCVGLTKAPAKNAKWYCDECKENLKKSKFSGANGRQ